MNGGRGQNGHPHGLREDDLLDLVEGSHDVAATALPPALHQRVAQLRADRAALQALGECPAPGGLVAAAQRIAERQALLEMEGEAQGRLAVSTISVKRPSLLETFFADRMSRRLALAAALAIVAGGVALVATRPGTSGPTPSIPITTADSGTGQTEPPLVPPAAADGPVPFDVASARADPGEQAIAVDEPAATALTMAQADDQGPAPMALDRALALAREGRLALRIISADTERAELRLDRLTLRDRPADGWRVAGIAPAGAVPTIRYAAPETPGPDVTALADAGPLPSELEHIDPAPLPPLPVYERPAGMVYIAEVRLDAESLSALLGAVGGRPGEQARFEELAAPAQPPQPALTLDAVMWWAQPAEAWEFWGRIPVAVERP